MTGNVVFVLDANVFIQAKRKYYAFDLAPKFWASLIQHAKTGSVLSIDRVKQELVKGKDELKEWAISDFAHGFASTNENDIIKCYGEVMNWVQSQDRFSSASKSAFANGADGWLVAYAKIKNCIVVTHEQFDSLRKNKVKIPNVCQVFDVQFLDTFEMLRKLGVRFS
jgi:hypothetical protein